MRPRTYVQYRTRLSQMEKPYPGLQKTMVFQKTITGSSKRPSATRHLIRVSKRPWPFKRPLPGLPKDHPKGAKGVTQHGPIRPYLLCTVPGRMDLKLPSLTTKNLRAMPPTRRVKMRRLLYGAVSVAILARKTLANTQACLPCPPENSRGYFTRD